MTHQTKRVMNPFVKIKYQLQAILSVADIEFEIFRTQFVVLADAAFDKNKTEKRNRIVWRLTERLHFIDRFQEFIGDAMQVQDILIASHNQECQDAVLLLNAFQLTYIEREYLNIVNEIKADLEGLRKLNINAHVEEQVLKRTLQVNRLIKLTARELFFQVGSRETLKFPPLSAEIVKQLDSIYTMNSENLVLDWFMQNMPSGSPEEFHEHMRTRVTEDAVLAFII
jgi:hypothetical protein